MVLNYVVNGRGITLREGLVLAIEPMVNVGADKVQVLSDGWTVVTVDGKPSAHFEHTVAITGNGPEILTKVSMVGHDLKLDNGIGTCGKDGQSVPVGVGLPTIKIDEITVGGTQG
jgi:predicted Zn-dependent protease